VLRRNLAAGLRRRNYALFVADSGDALVGFCEIYGHVFRRLAHRGLVVIGVRAAHTGSGLGTAMLRAAERWARRRGLRRLELDVSVRNPRAHRLYRRLGFVEEGRRRDTWVIGGRFVDDIVMSKLLPGKRAPRWPKGVR
jgi:RimJ/RimL family protein N-acetyltransferase